MKATLGSIALLFVLLLSSCNGKTSASLQNQSANKKVTISLNATRSSTVDPFKVDLSVKAYDFKDGKLEFEIYADDLNDKNVHFDWKDETNCFITITQSDKAVRTFQLIASPAQLQLAEI